MRSSHLTVAALLAALAAGPLFAQNDESTRDESEDACFSLLGRVNRYSALETAQSHGSIGFSVGAGMTAVPVEVGSTENYRVLLDARDSDAPDQVTMPRIFLVKGSAWPVDVGLTAGRSGVDGLDQASGHIQWTMYEQLARPTLAVRGSYSRLFTARRGQVDSAAADLIASYGFLRYFTLFASAGGSGNAARIEFARSRSDGDLGLAGADQGQVSEKRWADGSWAGGLQIRLVSPFVYVTGEARTDAGGWRTYGAKLSVGM